MAVGQNIKHQAAVTTVGKHSLHYLFSADRCVSKILASFALIYTGQDPPTATSNKVSSNNVVYSRCVSSNFLFSPSVTSATHYCNILEVYCITGVHSNQDLIWCEKIGIYIYGFLCTSWVLITMAPRNNLHQDHIYGIYTSMYIHTVYCGVLA